MLIPLLTNALRFAGVASLGYFVNDIVEWLKPNVPQVTNPQTRQPYKWVVPVILMIGGVLIGYLIKVINPKFK